MKYKVIISYDGTRYGGWQVQPNAPSIQAHIQDALTTILRAPAPLVAAGRTDAGVHATGQVAHFSSERAIEFYPFLYSLNSVLPRDIRVHEITSVPDAFHARFSAKKKVYHYHLHLAPFQSPFSLLYSTHIRAHLNLKRMEEALPSFLGTHDFSAFASSKCGNKAPQKTLYRLEMVPEPGGICIEFEGDGFLYKMVRNIVGTLLEIAQNKISTQTISQIFYEKTMRRAAPTAPPKGLFLHKVIY